MSAYKNEDTTSWDTRQAREAAAAAKSGDKAETAHRKAAKKKKARRRPRGMNPFLYLFLVLVISATAACIGWLLMDDLCALNKPWVEVNVEITDSDDLAAVSQKLTDAGLVNYPWFFELFGKIFHAEEKISVGTFTLNSNMDFLSLIDGMKPKKVVVQPELETVSVTVPEGYTVRETIALLAEKGVNTVEALTEAAETAQFDYDFIDNNSGSISRLEGYLFPDTYQFYVGHNPAKALGKLLSNFEAKMTPERMELVEKSGRSLKEIIIIASLIEKETDGSDRKKIASVIYNRLKDTSGKHGTYGVLGIDAALLYILPPENNGVIYASDLEKDTPYNLRKNAGLPPTAIANPGMKSIVAVLNPDKTDYYYYALGKDGVHHYFKTLREHVKFVESSEYGG